MFQHFRFLHPEYEINDFKDGKRYLDFAYIRPTMQICFEIDGWTVIRFSYGNEMKVGKLETVRKELSHK
ncbi:hypothetical protein [Rossellomorea vietnamensis]|uniref:hypothetical protein n=1 Tax=Rossellomorea vietnamensis TaxID=218284 RepID=UPI003CFA07F9